MSAERWSGVRRFRNRIYVGNVSSRSRDSDLKHAFGKHGSVVDVCVKKEFAFVEMDNEKQVDNAIDALDNFECHGRRWIVEPARRPGGDRKPPPFRGDRGGGGGRDGGRDRGGGRDGGRDGERDRRDGRPRGGGDRGRGGGGRDEKEGTHRRPAGMRPARGDFRIAVSGISSSTSWQDLKDWARKTGESVCYGEVVNENGERKGVVEFTSKADFLYALKHLNGEPLHGKPVSVSKYEGPVGDRGRDSGKDRMRPSRNHSRERGGRDHRHRSLSPRAHSRRGRGRRHDDDGKRSLSRSRSRSFSGSRSRSRPRAHGSHRHRSDHRRGGRSRRASRSPSARRSRSNSIASEKNGNNGAKTEPSNSTTNNAKITETQLSGHGGTGGSKMEVDQGAVNGDKQPQNDANQNQPRSRSASK